MANMSYCRFENTLRDLQDCEEALAEMVEAEDEFEPLSESEERAKLRLIALCSKIADRYAGDE